MDEMHIFKGLGSTVSKEADIFQPLKPAIENGSIQIIGMTTLSEFKKAFSKDPALYGRFLQVTKIYIPSSICPIAN